MKLGSCALALLLLLQPASARQEEDEMLSVEVIVTAVSANDVYLDRGRSAGLEPGDEVRLRLLGGETRRATIRSVSSNSARAELLEGPGAVGIGATGEVRVPARRLQEAAPPAEQGEPPPPTRAPPARAPNAGTQTPAHPPWAQGTGEWDPTAPLLAPIAARTPAERPWSARGRFFTSADSTWDSGEAEQAFARVRSGLELGIDNPFGHGDALDFAGEFFHRSVDTDEGEDETETELVLERLSYLRGGRRGEPNRVELGRFLHNEFPEFGVLDGVELAHRFESGSRAGVSLGFLPEPTDSLPTGKDAEVAIFYRYVAGEDEALALGTGYQKTWHEGEADRDLVVGNLDWAPTSRARVRASAWLDYYTSSDEIKEKGFELTQLFLDASYRWDDFGLGLFATELRFPEILRHEFTEVSAERLADERIRRLGLTGWTRASEHLRFDARGDLWEDQDETGGGGNASMTLSDLLWKRGSLSLGAFANSGDFSAGEGLRLSATRQAQACLLRLDYDLTRFEADSTSGEEILQHAIAASLDTTLGSSWDLSLYVQELLKDGDDALTVGITLQKRF